MPTIDSRVAEKMRSMPCTRPATVRAPIRNCGTRAALVALFALLLTSDALAQQGRRIMSCRDDGYGGVDCWSRPYDKKAFPRQEEDWDRKLDEQRLRDLMRRDQQRERRRQW